MEEYMAIVTVIVIATVTVTAIVAAQVAEPIQALLGVAQQQVSLFQQLGPRRHRVRVRLDLWHF